MTRVAVLVVLAAFVPALAAAEVRSVEVFHEDGEFRVVIAAMLDAPAPAVFAVLADIERWPEVNDLVKESDIIEVADANTLLVRTRSEGCVVGFCKSIEQVQWVRTRGERWMRADVVPAQSDLRDGWAVTHLTEEDGRTLFEYEMALTPDFWVPPVVGTYVLKRKLRKHAVETAIAVEAAARALP